MRSSAVLHACRRAKLRALTRTGARSASRPPAAPMEPARYQRRGHAAPERTLRCGASGAKRSERGSGSAAWPLPPPTRLLDPLRDEDVRVVRALVVPIRPEHEVAPVRAEHGEAVEALEKVICSSPLPSRFTMKSSKSRPVGSWWFELKMIFSPTGERTARSSLHRSP